MAELLPSSVQTGQGNDQFSLTLDHRSHINIIPTSRPKKITSIEGWSTAFIRFVAIYAEKFPTHTPDLMKYFEIVRDIASRRPGLAWQVYDIQFRLLKAQSNLPWHIMHYELWLKACTEPLPSHGQYRPYTGTGRPQSFHHPPFPNNRPWQKPRAPATTSQPRFWTKTCWPYNRGECQSTNCTLPHICGFCKGSHSAGQCTYTSREQAAQSLLGQPQGRPNQLRQSTGKPPTTR